MARIEWQPLAVPDIGDSALRAQQASANSIRGAFQDLSGVLDQWKGQRREENLTELYRRQNRFASGAVGPDGKPTGIPDVAGYTADLADGDLVGGLSYLSAADLANARGYVNELRSGRQAETTYARGQVIASREDDAFARGEVDRGTGLIIAREGNRIQADLAAGRITQEQADTQTAALMAQTTNASQIDAAAGYNRSGGAAQRDRYTWNRTLRTDQENDRADEILNEIVRNNIDGAGALEALNTNYRGESARVLNAIRDQLPNAFATLDSVVPPLGGVPGSEGNTPGESVSAGDITFSAPAGGFLGGAANSSRVLNYEARNAGFQRLPDRIRTVGDVSDYAIALNRRGVGSSATGTYQIVGQTLRGKNNQNGYAERVLGADWRNVEWTPEVEDRIAEAIFNDNRGTAAALRKQWVSLSSAEAERVRRMPWAEARRIIAAGESGAVVTPTPGGALRNSQRNLQDGLAVRTNNGAGGNQTDLAAGYVRAASRAGQIDTNGVVRELRGIPGSGDEPGTPGIFSNVSERDVRNAVRSLTNDPDLGVTASVAAWALAETVRGAFFGGRNVPNVGAARALILRTQNGDLRGQVTVVADNIELQGQLATAAAAETRAHAALAQAQARQRTGGAPESVLTPYIVAANQATATVRAIRQRAADPTLAQTVSPGGTASFAQTPPTAPVRPRAAPAPVRSTAPRIDRDEEYRRRTFGES